MFSVYLNLKSIKASQKFVSTFILLRFLGAYGMEKVNFDQSTNSWNLQAKTKNHPHFCAFIFTFITSYCIFCIVRDHPEFHDSQHFYTFYYDANYYFYTYLKYVFIIANAKPQPITSSKTDAKPKNNNSIYRWFSIVSEHLWAGLFLNGNMCFWRKSRV